VKGLVSEEEISDVAKLMKIENLLHLRKKNYQKMHMD